MKYINRLQNLVQRSFSESELWLINYLRKQGLTDQRTIARFIRDQSIDDNMRIAIISLVRKLPLFHIRETVFRVSEDNSESKLVRAEAIVSIGVIKDKRGIKCLKNIIIKEEDLLLKELAIVSIGEFNLRGVAAFLLKIFTNIEINYRLRGAALESFVNTSFSKIGLRLIRSYLNNEKSELKFWAIHALAHIGTMTDVPILADIAAKEDQKVEPWGTLADEANHAITRIYSRSHG